MSFIVTIVHVAVSLFLMLTVLLQAGNGGGMGATFGGGSSQGSVFGGSGAGNFLSKLTTGSAALFMCTSMTLAFLASSGGDDPLKKLSNQQKTHAKEMDRLDKEAEDLAKANQPDAAVVDELPEDPESSEVDLPEVEGVEAAEEPEAEEPDAEEPDAEEPDAEEPDAEEPDAKPATVPKVKRPVTPKPAAEKKPESVVPPSEPASVQGPAPAVEE